MRSPLYPASLSWRQAMPRLLALNHVGVLVGALSLYGIALMHPTQRNEVSLLYLWVWLECVGLVSWLITGHAMLLVMRRAWRQMEANALANSHMPLHKRLSTFDKWLLVGATVGGVLCSTVIAHEMFVAILDSGWAHGLLESTHPQWSITLFNASYGTLMIYVLAYFLERAKVAETRERLAQQLTDEAKLNLLRSQLDPHMLFNTLSNLYELIDSSPEQARTMLLRLISFLRATLQGSRSTQHALQAEFDLASDYLSLMQIRLGDRLRTQVDLPDGLRQVNVPAMLLQPLIENAIKHGIEPLKDGGDLRVIAQTQAGQLLLTVSNTMGRPIAGGHRKQRVMPQSSGGFGLHYVRDRLRAMYGGRAELTLRHDSNAGITQVSVTLPLAPSNSPFA